MNRTWHPESWSKQARRLGDSLFGRIEDGNWTEKDVIHFFKEPYGGALIDRRACKRIHRKLRKLQKINEKIICGGK